MSDPTRQIIEAIEGALVLDKVSSGDGVSVSLSRGDDVLASVEWYVTMLSGNRWHYVVSAKVGQDEFSRMERGFGDHQKSRAVWKAKDNFLDAIRWAEERLGRSIPWRRAPAVGSIQIKE